MNFRFAKQVDLVTKALIVLLLGWGLYALTFHMVGPLLIPDAELESHSAIMGDHLMHYESPAHQKVTDLSIFIALVGMLVVSMVWRSQSAQEASEDAKAVEGGLHHDLEVLKRALSQDEKSVLDEVEKESEITQDSLRFRLEWSKAKVSTIVTNLDRMGLVQRRREGKTYVVFLPSSFTVKKEE